MATTTPPKYLLCVDDVARLSGVSTRTVYRWLDAGELPRVQPGGFGHALRIAPRDLAAHLARSRRQAKKGSTP